MRKDNISHAAAAIIITVLHRVYLNMATARLLLVNFRYECHRMLQEAEVQFPKVHTHTQRSFKSKNSREPQTLVASAVISTVLGGKKRVTFKMAFSAVVLSRRSDTGCTLVDLQKTLPLLEGVQNNPVLFASDSFKQNSYITLQGEHKFFP